MRSQIMPLVIYGLGGVHTHAYTHIHSRNECDFKKLGMPGLITIKRGIQNYCHADMYVCVSIPEAINN